MPHSSTSEPYRLDTVKICGTTSIADRDLVAEAGADFFGALVDVEYSPRSITLDQAESLFDSPPVPGVVLLFNPSIGRVQEMVEKLDPFAVQLLGHESPEMVAALKNTVGCQVWKSLHIPARGHGEIDLESMSIQAEEFEDSGADVLLFTTVDMSTGDAKFGTGMVGDWGMIRSLIIHRAVPTFLGGGVTSVNAATALQAVKPNGIDICSGVESSPGVKDPQKLAELFKVIESLRE